MRGTHQAEKPSAQERSAKHSVPTDHGERVVSARLARYASRRDVQIVPLAHVITDAGESYKGQRITAPKPLADSDGGECPARAPSHTSPAVRFRPRKRRREVLCFGMGYYRDVSRVTLQMPAPERQAHFGMALFDILTNILHFNFLEEVYCGENCAPQPPARSQKKEWLMPLLPDASPD